MNAPAEGVVSLCELLGATLALRRQSSSRYRQLAVAPQGNGETRWQRAFSQLAVSEAEFAARIENALSGIDADSVLSERIAWAEPDCASMPALPDSPAAALGVARYNERCMRAVFEHLAATSSIESVRMRALEMALAESRHLSSIEKLLAPLQTADCGGPQRR